MSDYEPKKDAYARQREKWFQEEQQRRHQLADEDFELIRSREERVYIDFVPWRSEEYKLHATISCGSCEAVMLRSPGLQMWSCPDCGLRLHGVEARALLTAYEGALDVLSKTVRKQEKKKWRWQDWFRGKKDEAS